MALQWIEGFDSFNTANSLGLKGYSVLAAYNNMGSYSIGVGTGRNSGNCLKIAPAYASESTGKGSEFMVQAPLVHLGNTSSVSSFTLGFAFQYAASSFTGTNSNPMVLVGCFNSALASSADIPINTWLLGMSNGQLFLMVSTFTDQVAIGNANDGFSNTSNWTGVTTASANMTANTWYYVEVQAVNSSSGSVTVKQNGTTVISSSGNYSGQTAITKTMFTACPLVSHAGSGVNGYLAYYDDFYFLDTTGSSNTTFLGNVYSKISQPTANSSVAWTPSSGSNYSCVATNDPGQTSTNVSANTNGEEDLYTIGTVAGTIYGVQVNMSGYNVSGTGGVIPVFHTGSTDYSGNTLAFGASTKVVAEMYNTNPATSTQWQASDINGGTWGMKYSTP